MKAIITKIQDGSVFAKSVNPLGEKEPQMVDYIIANRSTMEYMANYTNWQQAESERVELEIGTLFQNQGYIYQYRNKEKRLISLGDEFEVTREGNFFKII